jgi:prolyl-tRNA synthetase
MKYDFDEFSTWLLSNEIVDAVSFRYGGGVVWLSRGLKIKANFCQLVSEAFRDAGFVQIELPFFIPPDIYSRQQQHFEGLSPYTYQIASSEAEFTSYLRTTSETPFTFLFKEWVNEQGVPLRFFQVVSVFRHEDASRLKPLLRVREITPFIESYTAVSSYEDAAEQVNSEVTVYRRIMDSLGISCLLNRRPLFDTFPEARYTVAFDVVLPDAQVFQIATVHHLGDSFGRAFEVCTANKSFIWQTSTGISGRAIGCVLAMHRDSLGVVLPFGISPYQLKIWELDKSQDSDGDARSLSHLICNAGLVEYDRLYIDSTPDTNLGKAQEEWFKQGGCVALFVDANSMTLTLRNGSVMRIKRREVLEAFQRAINDYADWLKDRSSQLLQRHVLSDATLQQALRIGFSGIIERPHCGNEECMENIRQRLAQIGQVLGIDADRPSLADVCEFCGNQAKATVRLALSPVDYH